MKILFINNYYSPAKYGWGYRQLCEEVVGGLAAKGHDIAVLTSTHRDGPEISQSYPVHRLLEIDPDWESDISGAWQFFVGRRRREKEAVEHLRRLVTEFSPDLIFVWHAVGLSKAMLKEAERLRKDKVIYYLADYQPELPDEYIQYWQGQGRKLSVKLFKQPLSSLALWLLEREGKPIQLEYNNVVCVSDYVRHRLVDQKLISANAVTIHNGVNLAEFSQNGKQETGFGLSPWRCLVGGRLVPEKGVHTVVQGFAALDSAERLKFKLTILGDGPTDYLDRLRRDIQENHLNNIIEFKSPVPREEMPEILAEHDILLLSSEYDEPLARAMQEGMAMNLLVIGTTTGGSGELLKHEGTGLVFEAGNPRSLATQLRRVIEAPELATDLAQRGCRAIREHFNIQRTIDEIEQYLHSLLTEEVKL